MIAATTPAATLPRTIQVDREAHDIPLAACLDLAATNGAAGNRDSRTLSRTLRVLSVEFVPEPEWTLCVLRRRVLGHDMLGLLHCSPL